MDETQKLIARIRGLAERTKESPSTLSRKLFGGGSRLFEIEAGSPMTMPVFERVKAEVARMEDEAKARRVT